MAEVKITNVVNLRVTDVEWRLIMKSLAIAAGLKINTKVEDRQAAANLNKFLLEQRVANVTDQLKVAKSALDWAILGPSPEDPDDTAAIAKMAYSVGHKMGKADAEREAGTDD